MKAIINFFDTLIEYIKTAFDFLVGVIEDIVYITKLAYDYLSDLPRLFGFLPVEIVSILLIIFGIVVIYKVLGREG